MLYVKYPPDAGHAQIEAEIDELTNTIISLAQTEVLRRLILKLRPEYRVNDVCDDLVHQITMDIDLNVDVSRRIHSYIFRQIHDYMSENDTMNVDGFIRFRLKKYVDELNDMAIQMIDDYEAKEEEKQLIAFCKDYIRRHHIPYRLAHVHFKQSERIQITDDKGHAYDDFLYENDQIKEVEEWLISSLVAMTPDRVIMHIARAGEMPVMDNIFEGRIDYCSNCSRCVHHSLGHKV